MKTDEKKKLIVNAIRELERSLCNLKYGEYDGVKSVTEREVEIESLQVHLRSAHTMLLQVTELELEESYKWS